MEFVFNAGATVDFDGLVKKLDAAIKANTVKFSVTIDGTEIEAKSFAAAAVEVKSAGFGVYCGEGTLPDEATLTCVVDPATGIVKSGASTTGFATGLIAMLATVATLL